MGGVSSTRRVTVINDNSSGVIRISESVVKKLKREERDRTTTENVDQSANNGSVEPHQQLVHQQQQQQQQHTQQSQQQIQTIPSVDYSSNSQLISGTVDSVALREQYEQQIKRMEKSWKSQINDYDKQNKQLWNLANDKLTANVNAVVNKYGNNRRAQPICQENRQKVTDCYALNKSQPLKCSKEVRNFIDCVNATRTEILTKNG